MLYREKYFDLNVRHFYEKLHEQHGISLSYTWGETTAYPPPNSPRPCRSQISADRFQQYANPHVYWLQRGVALCHRHAAKHSYTAHVSGPAKIHYLHHPQYGETVRLVRKCSSFGLDQIQVALPSGDQMFVPAWMLDEHRCCGMEVREHPQLAVAALLELRELVDLQMSRTAGEVASEASSTGGASRDLTTSGSSFLGDPIEARASPSYPTALPRTAEPHAPGSGDQQPSQP